MKMAEEEVVLQPGRERPSTRGRGRGRTYPRSETVGKIIIFLEALPSAPLSFSIVLHFLPALDPLPVRENLELVFHIVKGTNLLCV